MVFIHQTFNLTPRQRRVIMAVILTITFTSSHVQAATAAEFVPNASVSGTDALQQDDVPLSRGLVVPEGFDPAPVPAPSPTPKKKIWNTINAPDLETKPEHSSEPAVRTLTVVSTAYTSDPRETDGSPFTTANGTRVRDGIVAANFLKLGTRVRLPDQFGDKVFEVQDRMNARYTQRVDLWMLKKAEAKNWGIRRVRVEVLP